MARKAPKTAVVAFKVEKELAELLNKLPNKSAFIRKAIQAQLGMACPLCNGKGVVPRGLHDHYAPLLAQLRSRHCDGCGDESKRTFRSPQRERGEREKRQRDPGLARHPGALRLAQNVECAPWAADLEQHEEEAERDEPRTCEHRDPHRRRETCRSRRDCKKAGAGAAGHEIPRRLPIPMLLMDRLDAARADLTNRIGGLGPWRIARRRVRTIRAVINIIEAGHGAEFLMHPEMFLLAQ